MRWQSIVITGLLVASPALAQTSAGFDVSEHAFNAGGHPSAGVTLSSASYRITLDAIGDTVAGRQPASDSYRVETGFIAAYPPPGEVQGLDWIDPSTLVWNPERSVGNYNLYRDSVGNLPGAGYGICAQQQIPGETTQDTAPVAANSGRFYLVTAENRLAEEGTKGASGGVERLGTICP